MRSGRMVNVHEEKTSFISVSPRLSTVVGISRCSGVIGISEVIDISPGNLDSSLCFFQSSVSHDVLGI